MTTRLRDRSTAFTLLELLVVLAIVSVLREFLQAALFPDSRGRTHPQNLAVANQRPPAGDVAFDLRTTGT
jgi:prepilin-type N-terminal cleavage/methylation domain-containing protein